MVPSKWGNSENAPSLKRRSNSNVARSAWADEKVGVLDPAAAPITAEVAREVGRRLERDANRAFERGTSTQALAGRRHR